MECKDLWTKKNDNCPCVIYLQIKYMVENQNYIVTNYSNKIGRYYVKSSW